MAAVHLEDHSPDWARYFAVQRDDLRAVFGRSPVVIEHIGSTSVPGLPAKPVIDIALGAPSLALIEAHVPRMLAAGFAYVTKYEHVIPERRYFTRQPDDGLRVHVHGLVLGGPLWEAHLTFRDALRADEGLRDAYAALKRSLAIRFADDKAAYGEAKGPFIRAVLSGGRQD